MSVRDVAAEDCAPSPPKTVDQQTLRDLLEKHRTWWTSGRQGECPDLTDNDFSDCDFRDPTLRNSGEDSICLRSADLRNCRFGDVDLQDVDLRDADLTCADLSNTRNLLDRQLGGAVLCHAELPPLGVGKFEGLTKVDDLSKTANGLFVSMLLGCVYVWLVNGSTMDSQLMTNSSTSKLPIIQTEISIVTFYWDAPGILLGMYLYFHVYMQRLWEALARLPAVFPAGETVDVKTYPWLLNDMARNHFIRLQSHKPPLTSLQFVLSVTLAWLAVPLTLLMIWGRYLRRHDGVGTGLQILLLIFAVWAGHEFYGLAKRTLKRVGGLSSPAAGLTDTKWHLVRLPLYCIVLGGALGLVSYGAMWGNLPASASQFAGVSPRNPTTRWLRDHTGRLASEANLIGGPAGFKTSIDFGDGDISKRPVPWDNTDENAHTAQGVVWRFRNLRYAIAPRSFLPNMIIERTRMEGANLQGADLRYTRLVDTWLQGADLRGADLAHATLNNVNLQGAKLAGADVTDITLDNMRPDSLAGATFDHHTRPPDKYPALVQYGARFSDAPK